MGALLLVCASLAAAQTPAAQASATQISAARKPGEYALTPDSLPQPGVPRGQLEGPFEFHSHIFATK
jgi:enterochelin esterase family protein